MKVLHVAPYYDPSWAFGGIPRLIEGLCTQQKTHLSKISVLTTDVLTPTRRLDLPCIRYKEDVKIITLPNLSHSLAHKQCFLPCINQQAKNAVLEADIIHLHGYRNLLLRWVQKNAFKYNIPYLYTPNGCLQIHERRMLLKHSWDFCFPVPTQTNWVAVSRKERSIMTRSFKIPSQNDV